MLCYYFKERASRRGQPISNLIPGASRAALLAAGNGTIKRRHCRFVEAPCHVMSTSRAAMAAFQEQDAPKAGLTAGQQTGNGRCSKLSTQFGPWNEGGVILLLKVCNVFLRLITKCVFMASSFVGRSWQYLVTCINLHRGPLIGLGRGHARDAWPTRLSQRRE